MRRGEKHREGRQSGERGGTKRQAPGAASRPAEETPLRDAVVSLDAEDIALARLQADLRRAEAIQAPARRSTSPPRRRMTARLPAALLDRLRERARHDGTTASQVVERALERFLRLR
jgi:hypothetical protein